jgi:hypothetical protein
MDQAFLSHHSRETASKAVCDNEISLRKYSICATMIMSYTNNAVFSQNKAKGA